MKGSGSSIKKLFEKKNYLRGFPDGLVVKNPPSNAIHQSDPWSGKTPYAEKQLSLWATTTEARML